MQLQQGDPLQGEMKPCSLSLREVIDLQICQAIQNPASVNTIFTVHKFLYMYTVAFGHLNIIWG